MTVIVSWLRERKERDAGRLARTLLRKKEPVAVFLAAQCIETGVQIPLNIREEIERQIAKFVPPKTNEDIEKVN